MNLPPLGYIIESKRAGDRQMNKYKIGNPCPKCGERCAKTKYKDIIYMYGKLYSNDKMIRTCTNCGYEWKELPLDAKTSE